MPIITNQHERETYAHFWDGSDPGWCLVELEPYVKGTADYLIYNYHRSYERPMISGNHLAEVEIEMLKARVHVISRNEKLADPAREYSRRKRYSSLVIYGTFNYLLKRYEISVKDIALEKYTMFEEYLNNMSGRRILEELVEVAGDRTHGAREKYGN